MLDKLRNIFYSLTQVNQLMSLHAHLEADGSVVLKGLHLKKVNDKIVVEGKISDKENIPNNLPLVLSITGKGVLSKEGLTGTDGFKKLFPSSKREEFYVQEDKLENSTVMSVYRTEQLEQFFKELNINPDFVVGVELTPFAINDLCFALDEFPKQIGVFELLWGENKLAQFKVQKSETVIDSTIFGYSINQEFVYPLSIGLSYLALGMESVNKQDLWKKNTEEIKFAKLFKTTGVDFLCFFLLVLLVNFFVLNHYKKENKNKSEELSHYQSILNQLETYESEIEVKQEFIKKLNLSNVVRKSFFADQIAQTVPSGIQLTQLNIFPLLDKIKENQELVHEKNVILIKGVSASSMECNKWKMILSKLDWVSKIELNDYQINEKGLGVFTIKIQL